MLYPQTPIDMGRRSKPVPGTPYYGVPHEAHIAHVRKCARCKRAALREYVFQCPAYRAIDRDFYRIHLANGGSPQSAEPGSDL